jgi:ribose transport system substrate-binding protein
MTHAFFAFSRFTLLLLSLLWLGTGCERQPVANQGQQALAFFMAWGQRPDELIQSQIFLRRGGLLPGAQLRLYQAEGVALKQLQQWDECFEVSQKAPSLVLITAAPGAAERLADRIATARQRGVCVIGIGPSMQGVECDSWVTYDPAESGKLAAELAVKALKGKAQAEAKSACEGRVVELRGDDADPACALRHEVFMKTVQAEPGVVLVHDAPGGWTARGAQQRTLEAQRIQGEMQIIYAHNDAMAMGAALQLGQSRAGVLVIGTGGYGGPEGGMSLIQRGLLDASIFQPVLVDQAFDLYAQKRTDSSFKLLPTYQQPCQVMTPKTLAQ